MMATRNIFATMSDDKLDLFTEISARSRMDTEVTKAEIPFELQGDSTMIEATNLESSIKNQIESFLDKGYKRTESFHSAVLVYTKEIEANYNSVEEKNKLAVMLGYTKSMGQEIQKIVNLGKVIRECDLKII